MHLAAEGGHCDVIKVLLEAGGSPKSVDEAGITPYQLAADNGHHASANVSANSTRAVIDFNTAFKGDASTGEAGIAPVEQQSCECKHVCGQSGLELLVAGLWPMLLALAASFAAYWGNFLRA
jgi:ankyrin repeat protein